MLFRSSLPKLNLNTIVEEVVVVQPKSGKKNTSRRSVDKKEQLRIQFPSKETKKLNRSKDRPLNIQKQQQQPRILRKKSPTKIN